MSESPENPGSSEEERELHQRLLDGDRLAPVDLVTAYLEPLIAHLQQCNRGADPHHCGQAAEDALLSLIRNPSSFSPDDMGLAAYLRRSAQCDFINIWRRDGKHRQKRETWNVVELPENEGKYLGMEHREFHATDDGQENMSKRKAIVDREAVKLSEPDRRVLELMRRGERRTSAYAEAYGVSHLSPEEQAREIKQVKDRLKVRLKRAGKRDEQTS